jgi:hypothetical protein
VHDWLPSTLLGAPDALLTGTRLSQLWPALGVTIAATVLALALATAGLRAREI